MNKKAFGADALLLLTAAIWGFGFVAQKSSMEYLGPFTFNGIRFPLGSLSLLPLIFFRKKTANTSQKEKTGKKIRHILIAGIILFTAVMIQQAGMMFASAGNAGFITGLYVILTPLIGIFFKRKTKPATWAGIIFTITGLYFISAFNGLEKINPGDILIAVSAVFWAMHVILIDRFVKETDPIVLSSGQYAVCGILSLAAAFLFEPSISNFLNSANFDFFQNGLINWLPLPRLLNSLSSGIISFDEISGAAVPLLYGGLASVGIAYTLQAYAQQYAPPAHATIILCLEGSFAALGGIIILNEVLRAETLLGFLLMLTGMITSQIGLRYGEKIKTAKN